MIHSLLQRRKKESYKLSNMEDLRHMKMCQKRKFCASWKVQGRSRKSHMLPPKALFIQISMKLDQFTFKSAIWLLKLFLNNHFYSVGSSISVSCHMMGKKTQSALREQQGWTHSLQCWQRLATQIQWAHKVYPVF